MQSNRSAAIQLWIIGALIPLAFIVTGPFGKYDFGTFWIAGKQVLAGEVAEIYSPAAIEAYAQRFNLVSQPFAYPPSALFFFLPFALPPYLAGYIAWNVAGAAFFWWCARPYLPERFPSVLAVLTPAAIICLDFGQTGLLFGGLWLLAFRGRWPAVALLTFKPHLGLLAVLSLRGLRAWVATALMVLGLIAASALLFGPSLWLEFVRHTVNHAGRLGETKRWLFAGVGPAMGYGMWGWIAFAAIGALLLIRNVNLFTAATATFIISPYGFHYDMPVACLGLGLMIYDHWGDMPIRHRIPMAIGFLSPVIAISGVWWMPPLLCWALWAQTKYEVAPARLSSQTVDN